MFEMNLKKKNLNKTLLRIKITMMKGLFSHLCFWSLRSSPMYEQVNRDVSLVGAVLNENDYFEI